MTIDQIADAFAELLGVDPEHIRIERGSAPGRGRLVLTDAQAEEVLNRLTAPPSGAWEVTDRCGNCGKVLGS